MRMTRASASVVEARGVSRGGLGIDTILLVPLGLRLLQFTQPLLRLAHPLGARCRGPLGGLGRAPGRCMRIALQLVA